MRGMTNPFARKWSRIANEKRMEKLSPERRSEIARIAVKARWAKAALLSTTILCKGSQA